MEWGCGIKDRRTFHWTQTILIILNKTVKIGSYSVCISWKAKYETEILYNMKILKTTEKSEGSFPTKQKTMSLADEKGHQPQQH